MTLVELCEPLFQYVCRLNRSARLGASIAQGTVRAEIHALFAQIREKAQQVPGMGEQYERVRLPLVYFVDFMIKESALPFARGWEELAFEEEKFAGDEDFFEILEQTLADQSAQATERLAVFYTCVGLGMAGIYIRQPEKLRSYMNEMWARLRPRFGGDDTTRICPEAYENVDTRVIWPTAARGIGFIVVALVGLVVGVLGANFYMYYSAAKGLKSALATIRDGARAVIGTPDVGTDPNALTQDGEN
ncbi:MAG: DotU family type IV/VI secretion system protein [Phycisphaerales bacterium]